MIVVAKSIKGQEYMYLPRTAHQVKGMTPEKMAEFLNKQKHDLREHEVWHVHDVGPYDNAYAYGEMQTFERKRNGTIVRKGARA